MCENGECGQFTTAEDEELTPEQLVMRGKLNEMSEGVKANVEAHVARYFVILEDEARELAFRATNIRPGRSLRALREAQHRTAIRALIQLLAGPGDEEDEEGEGEGEEDAEATAKAERIMRVLHAMGAALAQAPDTPNK